MHQLGVTDTRLGRCVLWVHHHRLSGCEWAWKAHQFSGPFRAIWLQEMDTDIKGTTRYWHMLGQAICVGIHSSHP